MDKTVFITGATAGFGKACAEKFAGNGYRVIITGRRKEKLEGFRQQLEENYGARVLALCFDVQQKDEVFAAISSMPTEWQQVDILVNNAGLALGRDLIDQAELEDWEIMIDTNVKGLLYVSRALFPGMISRKKGHIINLGSISGKEVYEKGNVYCASKFAVHALTKAMRIDLLPNNIKVTGIYPGAADTEFSNVRFKGNDQAAQKMYEGYQPLVAEDVADVIYYCATQPDHVCINELEITCTAQANSFYTNRM
jgi:3-hydroxy acid dehydrogenase/malonic semialdehyde reductase